MALREFVTKTADVFQGGIVGIGEAEQDFELGVVLRGVAENGLVEARIAAVDGLQDGQRRQAVRRAH